MSILVTPMSAAALVAASLIRQTAAPDFPAVHGFASPSGMEAAVFWRRHAVTVACGPGFSGAEKRQYIVVKKLLTYKKDMFYNFA